ncbi:MAG: molybdopterin synthase sulfur carrier subunit [Oceanicoccus sp.]|jgi:molybdopterin synthase sulfur carrier subunit
MVQVLFFARLREQLGEASLSLALADEVYTVQGFVQQQLAAHNPEWVEHLLADNTICAINQQVVDLQHVLNDGDELAFFPPVTGG